MSRQAKILDKVLRGAFDKNLPFGDLRYLLLNLGFVERIRGSHHIFTKDLIDEILNLQPKNGRAKPYQVKQVRELIVAYGLATESGDTSDGEPEEEANG